MRKVVVDSGGEGGWIVVWKGRRGVRSAWEGMRGGMAFFDLFCWYSGFFFRGVKEGCAIVR